MRKKLKKNVLPQRIAKFGYSLLELLTCFSIFAICLGIAAPSFQIFGQTQRFKWEVLNLTQLIERASFESQLRGGRYSLILSESEARLVNEFGEDPVKKERIIFKHTSVILESQEKSAILNFFSSGVATPATILLKEKNNIASCKITISLRGRILTNCLKG